MLNDLLIVEDSPTQAESLRLLLYENGYSVVVAQSAEEAMEILRTGREFGLVISDVVMGGLDGYALSRFIREELNRNDLGIILLTSLNSPLDIVRGLAAGTDNYVTKPYDPDVLLARVRQVFAARNRRSTPIKASLGMEVEFLGMRFSISSDKEQIFDLLLSSVEDTIRVNGALEEAQRRLAKAHQQLTVHAQRMHDEARVSAGRFEALMGEVADSIFLLDAQGAVLEANASASDLLDDIAGGGGTRARTIFDVIERAEHERVHRALEEIPESRHVELRNVAVRGAGARVAYWDLSLAASPEREGELLAVSHDITARRETQRQLEESEARYRLLFDRNPAPMWLYETETFRFTAVNDAALRHYGYTREEFLQMSIADIRPSEDWSELRNVLSQDLPETLGHEVRHCTKDGSIIYVRAIGHAMQIGDAHARLVVIDDITDRRRAAARLESHVRQQAAIADIGQRALAGLEAAALVHESLLLVSTTLGVELTEAYELDAAHDELVLVDATGADLPAEARRVKMDSSSRLRPLLSTRNAVHISDLRAEPAVEPNGRLCAQGGVSSISVAIPGADIPFGLLSACSTAPRVFDQGEANFLAGIATSLGAAIERARALRALRESERRAHAILNTLSEGVVLLDRNDLVRWCNESVGRILGRTDLEIAGMQIRDLRIRFEDEKGNIVADDERPSAIALREHRPASRVMRVRMADGDSRWLLVNAQPLIGTDDSTAYAVVLSLVDLTDRKRAEERLHQNQRLEAVGRLAGGVAHDFNNLLTVISAYTEMLIAQSEPESPQAADLKEISLAANRATALTRQLLTFGGRKLVRAEPISLNTIVAGMRAMLARIVREDCELSYALDDTDPVIIADAGQLEQIVLNLVVNARDAMPAGGRVVIETRTEIVGADGLAGFPQRGAGTFALLSVSDTGTGMSREVRERIFEPFFTTKEQGKGTGLGLATVHGIVKEMGGEITVHTEMGRGTTFRILVPRTDVVPVAPLEQRAPLAGVATGETVLLAEDDSAVRQVVGQELVRLGYRVIEAGSGPQALAAATACASPLDLLITDMIMPGMNGRDLAMQVRALHPAVRVLYTSGYSGEIISREATNEPGFAFLEKPFSMASLAFHVRAALQGQDTDG